MSEEEYDEEDVNTSSSIYLTEDDDVAVCIGNGFNIANAAWEILRDENGHYKITNPKRTKQCKQAGWPHDDEKKHFTINNGKYRLHIGVSISYDGEHYCAYNEGTQYYRDTDDVLFRYHNNGYDDTYHTQKIEL